MFVHRTYRMFRKCCGTSSQRPPGVSAAGNSGSMLASQAAQIYSADPVWHEPSGTLRKRQVFLACGTPLRYVACFKVAQTNPMDKPSRSFWQIWNMSFGFLGIQFGWGLQMANMSAIYEYLGARADQIPILWLAAPLTGLLVQPIIGHASDRTWTRLGRRRPYFLAGALLSSLALIFMPRSSALWMAAGLLWILDASINISMEPFRAFVADLLPEHERTRGFAMQSLFIGLGAVVASALPS